MKCLSIVGIGFPGIISELATNCIVNSDVIVGYKKYIEEISNMLTPTQEVFHTGMKAERERVQYAIKRALEGKRVCIVCSGDPSLYGLASLTYELAEGKDIEISVIPSVTAAMAASAKLGAPISVDLVMLSLSDQLIPWSIIEKRIEAINIGDFVCAIYNPASKTRTTQLPYALNKFRELRGNLLIGAVHNAFRRDERVLIACIDNFDVSTVDMFTLVLVGNTSTKLIDGKMVTPRGYSIK